MKPSKLPTIASDMKFSDSLKKKINSSTTNLQSESLNSSNINLQSQNFNQTNIQPILTNIHSLTSSNVNLKSINLNQTSIKPILISNDRRNEPSNSSYINIPSQSLNQSIIKPILSNNDHRIQNEDKKTTKNVSFSDLIRRNQQLKNPNSGSLKNHPIKPQIIEEPMPNKLNPVNKNTSKLNSIVDNNNIDWYLEKSEKTNTLLPKLNSNLSINSEDNDNEFVYLYKEDEPSLGDEILEANLNDQPRNNIFSKKPILNPSKELEFFKKENLHKQKMINKLEKEIEYKQKVKKRNNDMFSSIPNIHLALGSNRNLRAIDHNYVDTKNFIKTTAKIQENDYYLNENSNYLKLPLINILSSDGTSKTIYDSYNGVTLEPISPLMNHMRRNSKIEIPPIRDFAEDKSLIDDTIKKFTKA